MKTLLIAISLMVGLVCGCSGKKQWEHGVDNDIKEMELAGWTYFETLGSPGDGKFTSEFDGSRVNSVNANWMDKGVAQNKEYGQALHFYSTRNYLKHDGDSFVLVFRRGVPGLR